MIYEVAVKSLTLEASKIEKIKLLREAAIMGQFNHPNVLKLYGVVLEIDLVTLIMEIAHNGDLKKYLTKSLANLSSSDPDIHKQLLGFSKDVAMGMHYLSSKGFVHRDLAARNVLLTARRNCKIADFGMSRDLLDEGYYISQNALIPVKWTAPEAVTQRKYSSASDVWSYGCVLYEIWSLGCDPYEDFTNSEVLLKLETGYRLPSPPGCPQLIYELMSQCWHPDPHHRPTFKEIRMSLLRNNSSRESNIYAALANTTTSPYEREEQVESGSPYYNTEHTYLKLNAMRH